MKLIGTGVLEGLSTRNDGSVKLVIGTQELGSDDAGRKLSVTHTGKKYNIK